MRLTKLATLCAFASVAAPSYAATGYVVTESVDSYAPCNLSPDLQHSNVDANGFAQKVTSGGLFTLLYQHQDSSVWDNDFYDYDVSNARSDNDTLGFDPTAGARSVAAWSGKPQDAHYLPCFTEASLSATNQCGVTAIWQVPLPVDQATTYAPAINVGGAGASGDVACQAGSLYDDSTSVASFTTARVSSNGAATTLTPGKVGVPSAGTLSVDCWVSQNGRINSVNW